MSSQISNLWDAVNSLSEANLLRLSKFATLTVKAIGRKAKGRTGEDLLHEAMLEIVEGRRKWSEDIDFFQHLIAAMRHIAKRWGLEKGEEYLESELPGFADLGRQSYSETASIELQEIRRLLEDDPTSLRIFDALALGLTAREAQSQLQISPLDYAAATRRIRRKLATLSPNLRQQKVIPESAV